MDDVWVIAVAYAFGGEGVLGLLEFRDEGEARTKMRELRRERLNCALFKGLPVADERRLPASLKSV